MTDTAATPMPSLYIPHGGGPCFFMEWSPPDFWTSTQAFLEGALAALPRRPRAILLISAHWVEPLFTVGTGAAPDLIFDYYGFPPHTYQLTYPAPGDPALGARIVAMLNAAGFPAVADPARGFDHGVFIPLKLMAPDADIPIVTLSLRAGYDAAEHIAVGRALAALRDEDVLILGSGMSFHSMAAMRSRDPDAPPRALAFDRWLADVVEAAPVARNDALANWSLGSEARFAHPPGGEEHLLPLMVAAGAGHGVDSRVVFSARELALPFSAVQFGG